MSSDSEALLPAHADPDQPRILVLVPHAGAERPSQGEPRTWFRRTYDRYVGGGMHFLSHALQLQILIDAMWRRVRAISVVPRVVVCHDLFALVPAIRLKRMFGCPVI